MDLQKLRRQQPTSKAGEDGDFVQLQKVRERRLKEKEAGKTKESQINRVQTPSGAIIEEHAHTFHRELKPRPTTAKRTQALQEYRQQLFDAVDTNDKALLERLISKQQQQGELISQVRHPETDENVLHYAASSSDKSDLTVYLINKLDDETILSSHEVQKSGIHGKNNILHTFTERNDMQMARYVLNRLNNPEKQLTLMTTETAAQIQGQRPRLFSCLHLAAFHGFKDLVKLYLSYGMDVNHINGKHDTALLWASRWGHNDTVEFLLEKGADTEVENDKGSTALHWAVRYEHTKTVEILLTKGGANPNRMRKLGLVAPVIIASAYGNTEILGLLLNHPDIEYDIRIRGGEMAIHHAAREGCLDALDMLIRRGADVDEQDEAGDTCLLLAAKSGHVDIVYYLIKNGAEINHRNHEGQDVWYFAINNEDNSLLKSLVEATKDGGIKGRPPLCIAASTGRSDKLKVLLDMKLDPTVGDQDDNTFLHYAAMNDKSEVIDKFHETLSVNVQNKKGNTPLHIACFRGHSRSIDVLIKCKSKSDIKNNKGETALHSAAYSKTITAESVHNLVDYTIKTHSWESLNAKDNLGNNCLHIAGKNAKPDVMWEFRFVPFKDRDQDGLTPLHEAVRPGEPEALHMMLDIFESMNRDARINEQSYETSETVLHMAAVEGHSKCVKRLIGLGADLANKDVNGDTVLHQLTSLTVTDDKNLQRYLDVFDMILDNVVTWWCIKQNISFPEEENADTYLSQRREAILFIVTEVCNKEGLSVMDLAFKIAAPDILSRLLMLPGVTLFEQANKQLGFDVTGVTPRTNDTLQKCCGGDRVAPIKLRDVQLRDISRKNIDAAFEMTRLSGIEWLIGHANKSRAAEILDLPPVRLIESYYTSMVAWTFVLLMLFHMVYMSVFTYTAVELLIKRRHGNELDSSDAVTILLYVFVPAEPAVILAYVGYSLIRFCVTRDLKRRQKLSRKRGLAQLVSVLGAYAFVGVCVLFAMLVIAWIILFVTDYSYQDYFVAAAICLGWLLTISFTRGIKIIHYFYRMLLSMILRDILRFLVVYVFVILAFGFAFHLLFQVAGDVVDIYPLPGDTLFMTFNLMLGMDELFSDAFESGMSAAGRTTTYVKVIYLMYMILGTVILLNLLIAMMNDSYQMILKENQVTWRIESVSLGVEIEAAFPLGGVFSNVMIHSGTLGPATKNSVSNERWHVRMRESLFNEYMRDMERKYTSSQDAVSKRLEELEMRTAAMEKQTTQKLEQITELLEQLTKRKI